LQVIVAPTKVRTIRSAAELHYWIWDDQPVWELAVNRGFLASSESLAFT